MKLKNPLFIVIALGSSLLSNEVDILDSSKLQDSSLKCARVKNNMVLQTYEGNLRNSQIWINNKNYTRKYKISKTPYEELAKSGQKGNFCNLVNANTKKVKSSHDANLKCARMKGGLVIEYYKGTLKNDQIWIGSKNYTGRYIITKESLEEKASSGVKGHYCNVVK